MTVDAERRRVLGLLLAEIGRLRLAGDKRAADALDQIALRVEHPDLTTRRAA